MFKEFYYEKFYGPGHIIHFDLFYHRATWKTTFLWRPRQCNLTGKRIWLVKAYEGTAVWSGPGEPAYGPGDPAIEKRWHSKKEHVWWLLRR